MPLKNLYYKGDVYMEPNYKTMEKKLKVIDKKVTAISKSEFEFVKGNLKKLIWYNFFIGLSRGLGMAIGFTVLGAVVIAILQKIVLLNLPGISRIIAEIIRLVQSSN